MIRSACSAPPSLEGSSGKAVRRPGLSHEAMNPRTLLSLALSALLSGCGAPAPSDGEPAAPVVLTVAVAASMRHAFEEIAAAFEARHPGTAVRASYGSSGGFYAQLLQKAPFDLFLSADREYPRQLVADGHAESDFPYARGRLVLWAPKDANLDVADRGMEALADRRVANVSIANPELAPYGRAAVQAMKGHGLEEALEEKLVRAENVGQAAQFVQSGAAQIGLFAYSLTFVEGMRDAGDLWLVPETSHAPLEQSGAILPWTAHPAEASALRDFLTGPEGRAILERHGFGAP